MKKAIRKIALAITFLGALFLFSQDLSAQPGGGGGPGGGDDPGCWPPPCVPIDGGAGWLIAAGAIYGGRKAYGSSRKKNENDEE